MNFSVVYILDYILYNKLSEIKLLFTIKSISKKYNNEDFLLEYKF